MTKKRIDSLLVRRGLVESQERAQALILAGEVMAGGKSISKPGTLVDEEIELRLLSKPPFVSRGGVKLAHALDTFSITVTSQVALDVGASTGGFTDCILQRGASRVYALDVGYGQLDYRLRIDPRVVVIERVNARYPFTLPEKVDLATLDLSFISLEKVLPNAASWVKEEGNILALFKPQFEVERREVSKGGLVRDPMLHARALARFVPWAVEQGFRIKGLTASPILGQSGNREFFFWLKKG